MIQKRQKIHTRKIDIATYEGSADSVIVEGVLKDDRLVETYRLTGNVLPPGTTVHHMIIRIEVKGPKLVIEDIEAGMPTIPHEACKETLECLESLKGVPIVSGFTNKVKERAGGVKGCNHLLALMTAMASAAIQGGFTALARNPIDPNTKKLLNLKRLKNTCWAWREDGPLMDLNK